MNCVTVNASPSGSVSFPNTVVPFKTVNSGVVSVSFTAVGASLTGVTVKLNVAVLVADPSLRVYVATGTVPL